MTLRSAQARLPHDPEAAAALLETTREHLERGLEDLRDLARGIHPTLLVDHGVGAAIRALAARAAIPVVVGDGLRGRLAAEIEAALYFSAAEAITNAAEHAQASEITVELDRDRDAVFVRVVDDGVGGADAENGSRLRGLRDRLATVDGTIDVHSNPRAGTRLVARIPLPTASGSR